jgi:hypothetical protein
MFPDYIVLAGENLEEVNNRSNERKSIFEGKGLENY